MRNQPLPVEKMEYIEQSIGICPRCDQTKVTTTTMNRVGVWYKIEDLPANRDPDVTYIECGRCGYMPEGKSYDERKDGLGFTRDEDGKIWFNLPGGEG